MGALAPIASSFRAVRHRLPVVAVITLSVAALVLVNQFIGFVAMLVLTPMLIDLTVGRQSSAKAAFTDSKGRIVRYLWWRFLVTVVGLGVTVAALGVAGVVVWSQWSASGQIGGAGAVAALGLIAVACAVSLACAVVGDLLAVAVAAGDRSPWASVRAVFAASERWTNVASLGVVYAMVFATLAVNGVTFGLFMVKSQGANAAAAVAPALADQVAGLAAGLPSVPVLWVLMAAMGIVTSFVSSVMRPVMLAQVLAAPTPTPRPVPLVPALAG